MLLSIIAFLGRSRPVRVYMASLLLLRSLNSNANYLLLVVWVKL